MSKLSTFILCFLFFCLIFGNTYQPIQSVDFKEVFEKKKEIELIENKNTLIGLIVDFFVDDNKDMWVLDGKECNIKKYNESGHHELTIGKRGQGPKEFMMPLSFSMYRDKIYVIDLLLRQLKIFDNKGNFKKSYKIDYSNSIKIHDSGNVIIAGPRIQSKKDLSKQRGNCIHIYNEKGNYLRSFFPISKNAFKIKLRCRGVSFDFDSDDNFYCVQETDYNIHKFSFSGKLIKSFSKKNLYYIPPPPVPFDKIYLRSKAEAWVRSWTHVNKIAVLPNGLILVNLLTFKPTEYTIDIYDTIGNFVLGGIKTELKLLYTDINNSIYFLREEAKPSIRRCILVCEIKT